MKNRKKLTTNQKISLISSVLKKAKGKRIKRIIKCENWEKYVRLYAQINIDLLVGFVRTLVDYQIKNHLRLKREKARELFKQGMSYRKIGIKIGINHPQRVKSLIMAKKR